MSQVVGLAHKQQFMIFYIGNNSEKTSHLMYSWFQAKYADLVDRGDTKD